MTTITTTETEALGACVQPSGIISSRFGQDRRRRSRRRRTTHQVLMCVGGGEQQQQSNNHHHHHHQHQQHELSMSSSQSSSTTTSSVAASSLLLIPSSPSSAAKSLRLQQDGFTINCGAANQLVHNLMLSQQHRSGQSAGVSHLLNSKYPATAKAAAVLTNGGAPKDYYCVGNNNNNCNNSNNNQSESDKNSSAAVASAGGFGGLSLLSALLLPLYQRVRDFVVSLVYAPVSTKLAAIEDTSDSNIDDQCVDISNSKQQKQPLGTLLTDCREHNNKNHVLAEAAGNLLHASLLELIAMEASETLPPRSSTTIAQHIAEPVAVVVKSAPARPVAVEPAAKMPTPAKQQHQKQPLLARDEFEQPPPTGTGTAATDGRLSKRQLKRQRKREAHQRRLAMAAAAIAAANASPTTCASAGRVKSPSPTCGGRSGAQHKHRHEKGRHQLERNIQDDRQAAEQWPSCDDDDEAADDANSDAGEDMTDCCFVAGSAVGLVSMHSSGQIGAGKSSAFTCLVRGESAADRLLPISVDCVAIAIAGATIIDSTATSTATPATHCVRVPPSLSWDISADELRTPSAKPERLERAKLRAANRRLLDDGLDPAAINQQIRADQMHQLLLQPRRRERQISECSDDFICFERGDDDADEEEEDGVGIEINYESSECEDEEDDDEDDESSDGESSSSSEEEDDDDDGEVAHDAASDSECESTSTKQPDSGFEEPITTVNKVRFALEKNEKFYQFHWAFAFRNSRRNYWEMVCRDRHRFMERVQRTSEALNPILEAGHREIILQRRADKEQQLKLCT